MAPSPNGITVAKVSWATDDTAAIQNAINKACPSGSNTGGAVFFPPGSYWVNTSSGPGLSINNQPFCFLYAEGIAATPVIGLPGGYPGNPPVGSQNNKPAAAAELVDPSVNEIIKTGNGSGESFKGIGFAHLGFRDLTECLASGAIHFVRQDRVFMLNVSVLDFCALHNDGYNIANVPATQPASAYTPRGYAVFFDQSGGSCVAGSACANYSQFEDLYNLSLVNDTNGIVSGNGRISRLNVHNAEIIGARAGGGRAITEQPNYSTDAGSPNLFQDVESNYFPVAEQIADCQGCKVVHSHHENSDSLSDVGSAGVGTTLWLEDSGGNKCISDAIDELDSSSPYMHVQIDAGCRNIQVGFIQATAGTILVKDDNVVNPGNYTSTWNGESSTQYSSSSDYVTKRINGSANYTVGDLACPSSTANSVTLCAINIDADQILGIMVASISTLNGSSANIMTTAGRGVVVTLDGTGGAASANNWVCTGSTAGVGTVSTSRCTPGKQIGILQTSVLANAASALIWFLPDRTPAQTVLGPLSATAGNLAAFNGTSGTLLQDSTLPSSKVVVPANVWFKATAPTISSGFGTSPSISVNNGTGAFVVNVGTGGTATSGVIGLPTASHGWVCIAQDTTTQSATVFITKQTAFSTTSCTIGNFNTSGAAAAWASGDNVVVSAFGI